jgi:hypothetical protein
MHAGAPAECRSMWLVGVYDSTFPAVALPQRRHTGGCKQASNWCRRNLPCKRNSHSWMQLLRRWLNSSRQLDRHWRKCRCTCMFSTLQMPTRAVQAVAIQSCVMIWHLSVLLVDPGREQGAAEGDRRPARRQQQQGASKPPGHRQCHAVPVICWAIMRMSDVTLCFMAQAATAQVAKAQAVSRR